ncbi:hypothetical protein FACS1894116_02340 [Betaproteobacteria bacterium]|nr:hypothetical protein FACS1894116_02340 [Betaproteobacteria bacterium]GHT97312.1 hypothetical protein FACS1894154_00390 [Betaproteobacteria bacterium]GHU27535.1 hypothetical protein FACS189497_00950 [Betaproteobacteria bacterium]
MPENLRRAHERNDEALEQIYIARARAEKKTHNFDLALPEYFTEHAEEALKSRYNLEFLGIGREVKERELESRMVKQLQQFILELGYGFCFIGR